MYNLTPQLFRAIAGVPVNKRVVEGLIKYLPEALERYNVNTDLRLAHFLAQICHESDSFNTLEEYASGSDYEGRRDLGNVYKGDGRRYKGRGVIQLTGRANYRRFGKILGLDLENNPELAEKPEVSVLTALEFWKQHNLNHWADRDNVKQVTRIINGGHNGLNDRIKKLARAKKVIASMGTEFKQKIDMKKIEEKQDIVETPNEVETNISPLPLFVQIHTENNNE